MLPVNLSMVYCLNNKLNFFLHASIVFVNIGIVTTMQTAISTIHQQLEVFKKNLWALCCLEITNGNLRVDLGLKWCKNNLLQENFSN